MTMVVLGLLLTAALAGSADAGGTPELGAEVRLIEVDVFVTDKRGRPVRDLTQEDFEVDEDGVRVAITNFQRPSGAEPRGQPQVAAGPSPPSLGTMPEPSPLVVYVDNANLTPGRRAQVLAGVLRFLRREMEAGRYRVLVVAHEGGVRPLTPLTADANAIEKAFEAVKRMPAQGGTDDDRNALYLVRDVLDAKRLGCESGFQFMVDIVRRSVEISLHKGRTTVSRLGEVLAALGAIPGRKALLYVSEGLQQRPGLHLFHQLMELCAGSREMDRETDRSLVLAAGQEYDVSPDLHEATALANANRVTIYTLDASGLKGFSSSSVEQDDHRFTPTALNDTIRTANLRQGQQILAEETDGTAFFDSNEPDRTLSGLDADSASHYALGYVPPHAPDRKTHRIDVRLKASKRGPRLRHRQSYRDEDAGDRVAQRTLSALLFGIEQNALALSVEAGDPVLGANGVFSVPFQIVVPPAREGEGRAGVLRVLIATRPTGAGATAADPAATIRQKVIPLTGPDRAGPATAAHTFVVALDLEAGDHDVAIGVRDESSALASYLRRHVHLARAAAR